MSRTVGKKTYGMYDVWLKYVEKLLLDNPQWKSRYAKYLPQYKIVRVEQTWTMKLVGSKFKKVTVIQEIEVLNYSRFRKVIEHFFDRAKHAIIQGEAIDITSSVGKICGCMVQRDFTKKGQRRINWGATRKYPLVWSEIKGRMEYQTLVYYTNDDWCRIKWVKTCQLTNESTYEFKPAAPNSAKTTGFTKEFSEALKNDPLLKYRYLFNPAIIRNGSNIS